jgi:hypothetical protein
MTAPDDLNSVLAKVEAYGILDEDPETIHHRLTLALQGVAATEGGRSIDLGAFDWTARMISKFKDAIHQEICDPAKGALKEEYQKYFQEALTPTSVAAVAGVVIKVVSLINPAFAVPTVAVYLALWLSKIGLNRWCSAPV